jgi:8-oxo-dGTP pyrophosphatase MutT (NUDIX family)
MSIISWSIPNSTIHVRCKIFRRDYKLAKPRIRNLALCVFRHRGRILVACLHDKTKNQDFYRPLGGGIKFGESAQEALVREIREELDCEIEEICLLGVLENRFVYDDRAGHEILFVFDAKFKDRSLYSLKHVPAHEGDDRMIKTKWINPGRKNRKKPLYPEGMIELLINSKKKGG